MSSRELIRKLSREQYISDLQERFDNKLTKLRNQQHGYQAAARIQSRGRPIMHRVGFPSVKTGALNWCESTIERDFCLYLERAPNVVAYVTQPITFWSSSLGKAKNYTPDFCFMDFEENLCFVEVKRSNYQAKPKVVEKMAAAEHYIKGLGHNFFIVTDSELRTTPEYHFFLISHSRTSQVTDEDLCELLRWLDTVEDEVSMQKAQRLLNGDYRGVVALAVYKRLVALSYENTAYGKLRSLTNA